MLIKIDNIQQLKICHQNILTLVSRLVQLGGGYSIRRKMDFQSALFVLEEKYLSISSGLKNGWITKLLKVLAYE